MMLGREFDASDAVQPLSLLLQYVIMIFDMVRRQAWEDRPWFEKVWDMITFTEPPVTLSGLIDNIHNHFGSPKDWRSNRGGESVDVLTVE